MLLSTSLPPERFSAQTINDGDDDEKKEADKISTELASTGKTHK